MLLTRGFRIFNLGLPLEQLIKMSFKYTISDSMK